MADANVQIAIEIVDQAARRALGDLNTATEKIGTTADKSNTKASKSLSLVEKETNKPKSGTDEAVFSFSALGKTIESELGTKGAGSVGLLSDSLSGGLLTSLGVVVVAAGALKSAFDLTLAAERNEQISNSFDELAKSAGLAGESLKDGLLAASQGLADDDAILEAANRAIVQLGSNAAVIPQTMEIARKATALFGDDLIQNFEKINDAVATGNVRLLKQFGIVVDADKAQREYAASIGTTKDKLSEFGQRQAIANAALATAAEKFKDVDENSNKATQAYTRFKVAVGEIADSTADAVRSSGLFSTVLDFLADRANHAALAIESLPPSADQAGGRLKKAEQDVRDFTRAIADIEAQSNINPLKFLFGDNALESLKQKLSQAKLEVLSAKEELERKQIDTPTVSVDTPSSVKDTSEEDERKRVELETKRLADAEAALEAEGTQRGEILQAQRDLELLSEQEFEAARSQLAVDQFTSEQALIDEKRAEGLISEQDYYTQGDALALKFAAGQAKRDADAFKADKELTKKKDAEEKLRAENLKGTLSYISTLQQSNVKELFYVGKAAALATAYIDGQAAVMKALASAPPPYNFALAGLVGAAAAINIGKIATASPPAFEQGGIVPGSSYSGDKVQARVNSGEMILNRGQQAKLFEMANGGSSNSQNAALLAALSQPISIQIDGREIINVTRGQLAGGRTFA